MDAFLISTGLVTLAEMGDRTQLLAFLLAAKFRRPLPIMLGILIATLANHAFAGFIGQWFADLMTPNVLRWVLALTFFAMAAWMMIPDKLDDDAPDNSQYGVLITTIIAFFLAEIGDKTQVATVALAARFDGLAWIVAGTTLGMMIANVPAIYLGDRFADKLPVRMIHLVAALVFVVLGVLTVLGVGEQLGF
jgi:putative Ca2+/H+ antiporter (TMEM165/GDT1 family)